MLASAQAKAKVGSAAPGAEGSTDPDESLQEKEARQAEVGTAQREATKHDLERAQARA